METYYHNDSRIQEWVEQIIEKIFTTCLLCGNDSDQEFQKGCQIVAKLTSLLQGFETFPSEYLADGLKQIIEQQLPDSRVIGNFPTFDETMNKMLQEGMLKVIDTQNDEIIAYTEEKNCKDEVLPSIEEEISVAENPVEVLDEDSKVCIAPAFKSENSNVNSHNLVSTSSITSESVKNTQVPINSERLNDVLSRLFPKSEVIWNITIKNQNFLVQVENILICLYDPIHSCKAEKYLKDGWRILVLREDDLAYPRRLEREIKTIKRIRKMSGVR